MFHPSIVFSNEYNDHLRRIDSIRSKVLTAIEEINIGKATLYGKPVNVMDPEEVIAFFYLLSKDNNIFKES